MTALILRLAGPMQAWGERSAFNSLRDSAPFPTRSGLIGMFAAVQGLERGASLERYDALEFLVRVDRPGTRLTDYHIVGGGFPKERTAATAGGSHKDAAVVTERQYLADAVFVVAVRGPQETVRDIAEALRRPHWAPYLGRRACVPDEPLLLRMGVNDPELELRERVPLSAPDRNVPRGSAEPGRVLVEFYGERQETDSSELSVADVPVSFGPSDRGYRKRALYQTVRQLPDELRDTGTDLVERLIDYALGGEESVGGTHEPRD